jgi:hypothetical protein
LSFQKEDISNSEAITVVTFVLCRVARQPFGPIAEKYSQAPGASTPQPQLLLSGFEHAVGHTKVRVNKRLICKQIMGLKKSGL